jgi:hypothetical protein
MDLSRGLGDVYKRQLHATSNPEASIANPSPRGTIP